MSFVAGCVWLRPAPGLSGPVRWSAVPGWEMDRQAEAWPALMRSCGVKQGTDALWTRICDAASAQPVPDDNAARRFFETWFEPYKVYAAYGRRQGLITGYYEPLLFGSFEKTDRFRYPLYRRPDDLLVIDLDSLYPELKGKRLRGRVNGKRVVPYFSRGQLDSRQPSPITGSELLWVDDPVELFFLHIQGSGRIRMPDGQMISVGYADQNGHPYRSIGRELIEMGELAVDDVNLFSIRDWLRSHPQRATELLSRNPSYVFFQVRPSGLDGPIGALQVPLTPERSIAVDSHVIPLGVPVWLDTTAPGDKKVAFRRLVFAQDVGGAIKGHVRADVFWGAGERAERMAGLMKEDGSLYVLLPRPLKGAPGDAPGL